MSLSEQTAAEVQELSWALADEQISAAETKRLEELLLGDADARKLYVFFNPKPPSGLETLLSQKTPVLRGLPNGGSNPTHSNV